MLDKDEIFDSTMLKFIDDFEYVLKVSDQTWGTMAVNASE